MEKLTSPIERFQFLSGLSDLSWDDCCDAWFEARKLLPSLAEYAKDAEARGRAAGLEEALKEYESCRNHYEEREKLAEVEACEDCARGIRKRIQQVTLGQVSGK